MPHRHKSKAFYPTTNHVLEFKYILQIEVELENRISEIDPFKEVCDYISQASIRIEHDRSHPSEP